MGIFELSVATIVICGTVGFAQNGKNVINFLSNSENSGHPDYPKMRNAAIFLVLGWIYLASVVTASFDKTFGTPVEKLMARKSEGVFYNPLVNAKIELRNNTPKMEMVPYGNPKEYKEGLVTYPGAQMFYVAYKAIDDKTLNIDNEIFQVNEDGNKITNSEGLEFVFRED